MYALRVRSILAAHLILFSAGVVLAAGPKLAGDKHFPTRWIFGEEQPFLRVQVDAGALSDTATESQTREAISQGLTWWTSAQYIPLPNVDFDTVISATGELIAATNVVRAATGIYFSGPIALATDVVSATEYSSLYQSNVTTGNIIQFILDRKGNIIDSLIGFGSKDSVLGISINYIFDPDSPTEKTGQIVLSDILLNGYMFQSIPDNWTILLNTITHELGHALGLDHAQFYSHLAFTKYNSYLPLMYPAEVLDASEQVLRVPRFDDRASLALLYPNVDYYFELGQIYGHAVIEGATPVLGANVIARKKDDTPGNNHTDELEFVTSCVSDFVMENDGSFFFGALPPGEYEIWVEPILSEFTGDSSVGPYSPSSFRPLPEYWSSPESGDPLLDNRSVWTGVSVAAGQSIELASPFIVSPNVSSATEERTQILGDRLVHFGGVAQSPDFTDDFQFTFHVSPADLAVIVSVTPNQTGVLGPDLNLYVRREDRVSRTQYDLHSTDSTPGVADQVVLATPAATPGNPPLLPGVYFIGVENAKGSAHRD